MVPMLVQVLDADGTPARNRTVYVIELATQPTFQGDQFALNPRSDNPGPMLNDEDFRRPAASV